MENLESSNPLNKLYTLLEKLNKFYNLGIILKDFR